MKSPILELMDFSFQYEDRSALNNVSFSLDQGEWLSIVGANGSGKSTLLKNLLRLASGRRRGEIFLKGKAQLEYSQKELARLLAYVPQTGGKAPPFTVMEFARLSRFPFGRHELALSAESGARLRRHLEMTSLVDLADRRMDRLSGGQLQRAYLVAALAQDAEILLLDEPASFLDPASTRYMNNLLKKLHQEEGKTIIAVTHDLSWPLDVGGKALVLGEGGQLYFGEAGNLPGNGVLERAFGCDFNYLVHPKTGKTLVVA